MSHRHHECCAGATRGSFALPGAERHYERSLPFAFEHGQLELEVLFDQKAVSGTATWRFERRSPDATTLVLDAIAFEITAVQLRSSTPTKSPWKNVGYHYDSERLEIELGEDFQRGEVRVRYSARPQRGLYFLAPDAAYPERPLQVWSQCQDEDARHWFPCHDKPHVKTTASFQITVPSRSSALCNGVLTEETTDKKRRRRTFRYEMTQRLPSYLFTLVVGDFAKVDDRPAELASGRSVPVQYWVPRGRVQDARRGFARTPEMIELFSRLTGVEYPYERYTQVVVSEFIFGGMENTSATTMYEHVLLDERAALDVESYDLVAHELAHQWFGDWVTCKDWAHAWLNEGFATYLEHIEREHRLDADEYLLGVERDLESYLSETSSRYSRPVVHREYHEPIDLFDRHLYEKGGLVLHALRTSLGDELFWKAIQRYLTHHAQGSVTTEDLRTAFEATSGRSLERFFDEWIHRAGHPNVKVKVSWSNSLLTIAFEQVGKHTYELRYEADVHDASGHVQRLQATSAERHFALSMSAPERPKHVVIDPALLLLGNVRIECPADLLEHQLLHASTARGRRQAARLLVSKPSYQHVALLAKVLGKGSESWMVRAACARALGEASGDEAFSALEQYTKVAHPKIRAVVAEALGRFRTKAACTLLTRMLRGERSYLVTSAITRALGRTRQPEAAPTLQSQLRQASWADVVAAAAAEGVAELRDPSAVRSLMDQTRYGKPTRLRRSAAIALARLSDERATREHLEELLDDPHPHLRSDVAHALGLLKDAAVRPALERRLHRESDGRVTRKLREVLQGLEQAGGQRELSDRLSQLERQLNEALARIATLESSKRKGKSA